MINTEEFHNFKFSCDATPVSIDLYDWKKKKLVTVAPIFLR